MAVWLIAIGVIVLVVSLAGLGVYGFPVAGVFLLMGIGALIAGKRSSGAGTMERTKRPEPTGRPRMSHAAGDTANERQGQV